MHASLMWTISDFPGYANLSGWSTKGEYACPCCNKKTRSRCLKKGRKFCYMGHRRWLDAEHNFWTDCSSFDGTVELEHRPPCLSSVDILHQLESKNVENKFGKEEPTRKRRRNEKVVLDKSKQHNWKKKSIFFELPYWKDNLIRHNLDVMHIEKNVCDNVLWTLLNIEGKGKDNLKSRLDLVDIGIRKALHPQQRNGKHIYILHALHWTI